jgi:E3 ubiquitin-protein ligase RNF13
MTEHQALNALRMREQRDRRRRAAARQLASQSSDPSRSQDAAHHSPRQPDQMLCMICRDELDVGDTLATLECRHVFHPSCMDEWAATQAEGDQDPKCPGCRQPLRVRAHFVRTAPEVAHLATPGAPHQLNTPPSASEQGSAISDFHALPWWPAESPNEPLCSPFYHAATQLPNGQLSMIVDPGAWTNLMGARLARALATRALTNNQSPSRTRLSTAGIQGGGDGSQRCEWQLSCPIACTYADGSAHLHKITAPIVQGSGEELPGLLGLRSLEHERAILDYGSHTCTL